MLYSPISNIKCYFNVINPITGVGNLTTGQQPYHGSATLVAGHKQTSQGMAGRTNFPPTIRTTLLHMILLKLGTLWKFNQTTSWFSQFITKTPKKTYSTFIAQCDFSWVVPHKYAMHEIARRAGS